MDTSPQNNIEVAPRTFDGCNFISDPISEVRGTS
jgi:hypothetical protein